MLYSMFCPYFISLLTLLVHQTFSQRQPPLTSDKPVQPAPSPNTNCPGACMLGQILCPSRRVQCVIPSSCYQLVTNGKEIMYVIKKSVNSALPIVATGKQTAGVLSTCQDHNPNCRPFMDLCKDKLYYMFLATYCPKSCGFCSSPTSNTTTTTPQPTSNVVKQPSEFSIFASSPAPLPSRRAVKYVLEGKKRPLRKWPAATTIPPSTTTTVISQSTTVTASKKSKKEKL